MSFDLKEIAKSWLIAAHPTPLQEEIAQKRYHTCLQCEHYNPSRAITHDEYCEDCGCPLSKKIFSPKYNACDQGNWQLTDDQYLDEYFRKKKVTKKDKSII
jgi:hypothetical protein